MIEKLANKISWILFNHKIIEENDRELVEYGLFHITSSALHIILLLVAGLLCSALPHIAIYSLFFCTLKQNIGGAHAAKHWACLWGFTFMALAFALIGKWIPAGTYSLFLPIALSDLARALIVWKAPVMHPNAPEQPREKLKEFRERAIKIVIVQLVVICTLLFFDQLAVFALCASFGSISAAVSLIIPIKGGEIE